jgi:uncharacterized protein YutE (UPF0331/DUF86 family)
MDRQLITQKLESLRHCLQRVADRCPPTAAELADDPDLQDIIALNLTRAVQLCVDVAAHIISTQKMTAPDTMGQAFEALASAKIIDEHIADRMKRAVGFRNIAVHSYETIDWQIVHAVCTRNIDDFIQFARAVDRWL